jgi:hypothetical protein
LDLCNRMYRPIELSYIFVNLKFTSYKWEVHAMECEWICMRTGPEKSCTHGLANTVPPESDLKKISSWMRVFCSWLFCWECDHVYYRAK